MKTMRAAVLHAVNDLRYEEVALPELKPNEVLLKVHACGVCGSDLPRVLTTGTYHFPTIPGHEFSGSVAAVGTQANPALLGKRASVIPLIPCRKCKLCEVGQFSLCEHYDFLGSRSDGGFAEYVRVPQENLILIPDEVDSESAAMLEPISVALHVIHLCSVKPEDNVAVFGLGAVGIFIAQWARAFGAKHVYAIDIDPQKVDVAKQCGLKDAVCSAKQDIEAMISAQTDGLGVDVAIEASGAVPALAQAIGLLRIAGTLGLVGRPVKDAVIPNGAYEKILRKQLHIQGSWSFAFTRFPHHDWEESLNALQRGAIVTAPLITHRFPLRETYHAISLMAGKETFVHKILIEPELG